MKHARLSDMLKNDGVLEYKGKVLWTDIDCVYWVTTNATDDKGIEETLNYPFYVGKNLQEALDAIYQ